MSKWPMVITLRQVRVCADFAIIGQLVVLQMKGQYIYIYNIYIIKKERKKEGKHWKLLSTHFKLPALSSN